MTLASYFQRNTNIKETGQDPSQRRNTLEVENPIGSFTHPQPSFDTLYTLPRVQTLGEGSFGTVKVAQHKVTAKEYAVKIIDRTRLKPKDDAAVFREVDILQELKSHPNIVGLVDFFETKDTFWVVQELAPNGDVFDALAKRKFYSEEDARSLAKNLISALEYMHSKNIAHRDLKPENLLLANTDSDSDNLKVADFGFAKKISQGLSTRCGTPAFVAPEVIMGLCPYDAKVDTWSCGVILYLLLGGYPPFQSKDTQSLFRKIRAADYSFHDVYWKPISNEAKQLIVRMITISPKARISAKDALNSEWITTQDEALNSKMKQTNLESSIEQLRKFNAKRKLKGLVHTVKFLTGASFWDSEVVSFWTPPNQNDDGKSQDTSSIRTSFNGTKLVSAKVGQTFKDFYTLQHEIRSGSHATIYHGKTIEGNGDFAIKAFKRNGPKNDSKVMNEVAILHSLRHFHIVKLLDFFEERTYFYLIMERMIGGDVFEKIVEKTQYTEKDARDLVKDLLHAVEYIHGRGVAHRDLKPQNLLLVTENDDTSIKICDFGFAKRVHTPQSLFTRCGTPTYVAPEILKNHPHDISVDMWSVGVIIYVVLVGYPPFIDEDQKRLFEKIRHGVFEFYPEDWDPVSEDAKDLIRKCLVVDPCNRFTVSEALEHIWIVGGNDDDLMDHDLTDSQRGVRRSIEEFNSSNSAENTRWRSCMSLADI
jgi:serine/threonine protein kinase